MDRKRTAGMRTLPSGSRGEDEPRHARSDGVLGTLVVVTDRGHRPENKVAFHVPSTRKYAGDDSRFNVSPASAVNQLTLVSMLPRFAAGHACVAACLALCLAGHRVAVPSQIGSRGKIATSSLNDMAVTWRYLDMQRNRKRENA